MVDQSDTEMSREGDGVYVGLTNDALELISIVNRVKSPKAGAIVTFSGRLPTLSD